MRHIETTKPILPYAGRDTDASFQCNENLIYIHNSNGRLHGYIGWTIAAFLSVFPLVRAFVPGKTWFPFDEPGAAGWLGLVVYLFAVFACISAGFWWSTIRANLKTGQVERTSRWGPFRRHTIAPLTAFSEVRLERDSDGDTTVELAGLQQIQIAWGRNRKESVRIAREFAARVSLPVVGETEDDGETVAE
jgi:hypothetical protein